MKNPHKNNNSTQKQNIVTIFIKNGPKYEYELTDSYQKFNEDFYKKGYDLSSGELYYEDKNNCKIIIKSKNDYILFLKFFRTGNNTKLFYEKNFAQSFIRDAQFEEVKNVFSETDLSKLENSELNLDHYESVTTLAELVKGLNENYLESAMLLIKKYIKKICFIKIFGKKYRKVNTKKIPNNKIKEDKILINYKISKIDNNLNKLISNHNCLNELFSTMVQLENLNIKKSCLLLSKINFDANHNKNNIYETDIMKSSLINHYGIQCNKCHMNPIKGHRFKCPKCLNYNLCSSCEELNSIKLFHPHLNFILVRKPEKNLGEFSYSFQCLTKILKFEFKKEQIKKGKILINGILVKNNFNLPWPGNKNTMFKCDKSLSTIFCEKIFLPPLNLGQSANIDLVFNNVQNMDKDEYICFLNFVVNGIKYGKTLNVTIKLT